MPIPVYPTLSKGISRSGFDVESADAEAIKAQTDGGYNYKRPRNTRSGVQVWSFSYQDLPQQDVDALKLHWKTVRDSAPFTWTDPTDSTEHTVTFSEKPKYSYVGFNGVSNIWNVQVKLEEV